MNTKRIIDIIQCPECGTTPIVLPIEITNKDIKKGLVNCPKCYGVVGAINNFKFDFIHFDNNVNFEDIEDSVRSGELPIEINSKPEIQIINFNDNRIKYSGQWREVDNKFACSEARPGDKACFEAECTSISLQILSHSWSGHVLIRIDGDNEIIHDLYKADPNLIRDIVVDIPLKKGLHRIEVIPLGIKNEKSSAAQILLQSISIVTDTPVEYSRKTENKGNAFPSRFLELIKQIPPGGIILDCGGGNRQLGDDRYLNFEYMQFELSDVYGDGHSIPFKDNSFDLILSQAVMEHLYNPFKGAAEIIRILKPGGILWAESAFMQPLHAVPYHYFNTTIWGIEELFKDLIKIESGCFGGLSDTFAWITRCTSIPQSLGPQKYEELLQTFRDIDVLVKPEELKQIASAVYLLARKA